uniref:RNA exonuclease 1 homolog n=1 Tax=Castor canadensis TaxID=51338 RepID=A0A8B7W732_CASCN|nr:RNA exonuclease 1 homolog [Castor canadensis]
MSLKPSARAWFPPGHPEACKVASYTVPDLLLPCYQPARNPGLWVPPMCGQSPGFICVQAPPTRRSPVVTSQEGFHWGPQQGQRKPSGWVQPDLPPTERFSSVHSSAPGEKGQVVQVPSPGLAKTPTGSKRILTANWRPPSNGPKPGSQPPKMRTLSGMASKTSSTIAPKPSAHSSSSKKPIIPKEFGGKVPMSIRQRYLSHLTEEYLKFYSLQEAIEKAQAEEKMAYDGSLCKTTYLNVVVSTLKKLRGLLPSIVPGLTRAALYSRLLGYLLTEDQRKVNGFPFAHPERPGGAVLHTAEKPKGASHRVCCRCGTQYDVSSSGRHVPNEQCFYHWGRLLSCRAAGGWEMRYACCAATKGSSGCRVARQHVQDGRKENLQGFVQTFRKEPCEEAHPGIYALDCEMSYTTHSLELTRVTVVNAEMQVVFDTFVKPDNEIVDYNTKFSGVTEADLKFTRTTLRDVQAALLAMFSSDTILIGHSLESDLLALKVIHSTVVDTSVLFPHHLGLPYKRSLRNLVAHHLSRIIQDNVNGHSSKEDASACMQLVLWKIQEDAKTSPDSCPAPTSPVTRVSSPTFSTSQASFGQCDKSQKLALVTSLRYGKRQPAT